MKFNKLKALGLLMFCVSLSVTSLTGCGNKNQNIVVADEQPVLTTTQQNVAKIKEAIPSIDETQATEAMSALENPEVFSEPFGLITDITAEVDETGSGRASIMNESATTYQLSIVKNQITGILDADENTAWLNPNLSTAASMDFSDVEVSVEPTAEPKPDSQSSISDVLVDEDSDENTDVDDNSVKEEYCTYLAIDENTYELHSNDTLTSSTVIYGTRVSKYVDKINKCLKENDYNAVNEDLFYDLMATSFMNGKTISKEMKAPNYSVVMAYIAEVYSDTPAELKSTQLYVRGNYCEFTYYINDNVILMTSNGDVTWDGNSYDMGEDLQILKDALTSSKAPADDTQNDDTQTDADSTVADDSITPQPTVFVPADSNEQNTYNLIKDNDKLAILAKHADRIVPFICQRGTVKSIDNDMIVYESIVVSAGDALANYLYVKVYQDGRVDLIDMNNNVIASLMP